MIRELLSEMSRSCCSRLVSVNFVTDVNQSLLAHMNRVSGVIFSLENEWLLSVGRDKYLQWHDCTTGKRLRGYQTEAWCTSLQYPFILSIRKALNYYSGINFHLIT